MSDDVEVRIKRDVLHFMMKVAFIEIRAATSLNVAKKYADIFHGLPMALLACSRVDDYDTQFARLLERAKRSGLETYVLELHEDAIRAVTRSG
ncbi:hypothetical protein [Stenotrophomonas sp. PD6]|uniref:hypothetical protein n=1 Tax=Stenotrophomonas sp. PD6 TaxID=3368612 RepID=UPI003BA27DF5